MIGIFGALGIALVTYVVASRRRRPFPLWTPIIVDGVQVGWRHRDAKRYGDLI